MSEVARKIGNAYNIPYEIFESPNVSEMQNIDTSELPVGSRCFVTENNTTYLLTKQGQWKAIPENGQTGGLNGTDGVTFVPILTKAPEGYNLTWKESSIKNQAPNSVTIKNGFFVAQNAPKEPSGVWINPSGEDIVVPEVVQELGQEDKNVISQKALTNILSPILVNGGDAIRNEISGKKVLSVDDVSRLPHEIECVITGVKQPELVTVQQKKLDGSLIATFEPNTTGAIRGMKSYYPGMALVADSPNAIINIGYNMDTKKYIDKKFDQLRKDLAKEA